MISFMVEPVLALVAAAGSPNTCTEMKEMTRSGEAIIWSMNTYGVVPERTSCMEASTMTTRILTVTMGMTSFNLSI